MRVYFISIFIHVLLISVAKHNDNDRLIDKIIDGQLITKNDLIKTFPDKFSSYQDKFIGCGYQFDINLFAGVLEGVKNDTIYNVLLVFRDSKPIMFKEIPKSSFYMKNESIIEEYILGRIYVEKKSKKDCITAYTEIFSPLKIDSLEDKFSYKIVEVLKVDSLEFCN